MELQEKDEQKEKSILVKLIKRSPGIKIAT